MAELLLERKDVNPNSPDRDGRARRRSLPRGDTKV